MNLIIRTEMFIDDDCPPRKRNQCVSFRMIQSRKRSWALLSFLIGLCWIVLLNLIHFFLFPGKTTLSTWHPLLLPTPNSLNKGFNFTRNESRNFPNPFLLVSLWLFIPNNWITCFNFLMSMKTCKVKVRLSVNISL